MEPLPAKPSGPPLAGQRSPGVHTHTRATPRTPRAQLAPAKQAAAAADMGGSGSKDSGADYDGTAPPAPRPKKLDKAAEKRLRAQDAKLAKEQDKLSKDRDRVQTQLDQLNRDLARIAKEREGIQRDLSVRDDATLPRGAAASAPSASASASASTAKGERPVSVSSSSDVSLDPVGTAKKDAPKAATTTAAAAAAHAAHAPSKSAANNKLVVSTARNDEPMTPEEAREAEDTIGTGPARTPGSALSPDKKKRMSDNLADRLSAVEATLGNQDAQESQAEIDKAIERLHKNDPTLTELVLNNMLFFLNAEKDKRVAKQTKLAEAMQKNTHLVTLSLVHNMLDDEFAVAISQALAHNKTLTSLNLESNNITGVGAQALAHMLTENSALKELRINNQKFPISTEGEEALMHALEVNETLVKLNLNIRDLGIRQSIEKHLSANLDRVRQERYEQNRDSMVVPLTDLKRKIMSIFTDNYEEAEADFSLDMEFQKLKEEEKIALATGLANNTRVTTLKMVKCGLRDNFAEELGKALKKNATLEVLSLESNSITGTGVVALAEGLKENKTLKELRLQGQTAAISTEGEDALASALEVNETLMKLGLAVRNPTARERIDKALRRNNDLVRQQRSSKRLSMSSTDG